MRSRGIVVLCLLSMAAYACAAENPPAAELGNSATTNTGPTGKSGGGVLESTDASLDVDAAEVSDAGSDRLDAADAFDGFYPPPESECNPDLSIGAASDSTPGRFAGITRDELTIAWTAPNGDGKTSLFVAERDTPNEAFGTPSAVTNDAASDGVAITDDGLSLYAVAADHRSFIAYTRATRDDAFEVGDDWMFDSVIQALDAGEMVGDPVFVNSGVVFLYSQYGKSADTMRLASRISINAGFSPAYTMAFDEFRASGSLRRRPTGTGEDFQVIFYWDEVAQTEKLARLNGTEMILKVKDLGGHPWAQATAGCTRVWFGDDAIRSAPAF